MKKKTTILVIILVLTILIGGGVWFAKNWKYDVSWKGERSVEILTFAGCHYSPGIINADDEHFSEYWAKATEKYEFGFDDVVTEMLRCLNNRKKDYENEEERANNGPIVLSEEEINQKINEQLDETMVYEKWRRPRKLTDEEKKNDYTSVRESILRVDKKPSSEYLIKRIDELQNYQRKFLNREFSVFKNQN